MRAAVAISISALLAWGCHAAPPLQQSCHGKPVDLCGPYEYAEVTAASVEPDDLPVGDLRQMAHIHVETATCGSDSPAAHVVDMSALASGSELEGGVASQVMKLLTLQDGHGGDPVPGDGVIDVMVPNPFGAGIPPSTDITLRFIIRSTRVLQPGMPVGGCVGPAFDIPYRTGVFDPHLASG